MEYLIGGLIVFFCIYKAMVYFGRKNAVEVLCHNYQLDPQKVAGRVGFAYETQFCKSC